MSELINNSKFRKEKLKELILKLHKGKNPQKVRAELVTHLDRSLMEKSLKWNRSLSRKVFLNQKYSSFVMFMAKCSMDISTRVGQSRFQKGIR